MNVFDMTAAEALDTIHQIRDAFGWTVAVITRADVAYRYWDQLAIHGEADLDEATAKEYIANQDNGVDIPDEVWEKIRTHESFSGCFENDWVMEAAYEEIDFAIRYAIREMAQVK